jgi:hypothetical protein
MDAATREALTGLPLFVRQVRWWILALLFSVTVINCVDGQALSVLAPIIRSLFDREPLRNDLVAA